MSETQSPSPSWIGGALVGDQVLKLEVVNGTLTAEQDPAAFGDAAKQFVDEVMQRWIAEMDANRRFTAKTLELVLFHAARQQSGHGDTISVEHAARVIADLLWDGR